MIKVNSEKYSDCEGMSVGEFLKSRNYRKMYIAVELNNEILPKGQYESTILKDGDTLEVVSFVGGG